MRAVESGAIYQGFVPVILAIKYDPRNSIVFFYFSNAVYSKRTLSLKIEFNEEVKFAAERIA